MLYRGHATHDKILYLILCFNQCVRLVPFFACVAVAEICLFSLSIQESLSVYCKIIPKLINLI